MQSSERSIFFKNFWFSLFNFTINAASKLDPISLLARFCSILRLQISLILINCSHLELSFELSNFSGKFKNFSR